MKTRMPEIDEAEFEMTPMIDIVFLLIIFFMVVASEITNKVPIEVPKADEAQVPDDIEGRVEITIEADGTFYQGLREVPFESLAGELARLNREVDDLKVYVRADADAPHRYVQDVMDAAKEAVILQVIFGTLEE